MTELLVFMLSCYGGANGIAFSRLLQPLRLWFEFSNVNYDTDGNFIGGKVRTSVIFKFLTKLINCPLCLGFWLGIILSLNVYSPCGNMMTYPEFNYTALVFDGFLGSAAAWITHLLLRSRMEGA